MRCAMLFWKRLQFLFYKFLGREYAARVCGHKTKLMGKIEVFGETFICSFHKNNLGYCCKCLSDMAIPCARCKGPILESHPITLYRKTSQTPEWAVSYKKDVSSVIGCARCADTIADIVGYWVAPGEVLLSSKK